MHRRTHRVTALLALCALAPAALLVRPGRAQDAPPSAPAAPPAQGFPDLAGALKASPGCLGVEQAALKSGKLAIFAWFENKKAALAWYNSPTHRAMSRMMNVQRQTKALEGVTDEKIPIMVVASITRGKPGDAPGGLPVSQIAIEMYAPLPGGFAHNGRFAPASVKVPGLHESGKTAAQPGQ